MSKILLKDQDGKVVEMIQVKPGFIPDGYELVPEEDINTEELKLARAARMIEIRAKRDQMLKINDREWLIAKKMNQPTEDIEADAQILRMVPQTAQTELNKKRSLNTIKSYDVFADLELARSYEE